MKILLRADRLVLIPESDEDRAALSSWCDGHENFAFAMEPNSGTGVSLIALGLRPEACREPINVTSTSPEPIRLIGNFAPTPFMLDGARYACVEAFWQSLRFQPPERALIAALDGAEAKRAGAAKPYGAHVSYGDRSVPVGAYEHWQLMRRACRAKFEPNADTRAALLATGAPSRPHRSARQPDQSRRHHGQHLDGSALHPRQVRSSTEDA